MNQQKYKSKSAKHDFDEDHFNRLKKIQGEIEQSKQMAARHSKQASFFEEDQPRQKSQKLPLVMQKFSNTTKLIGQPGLRMSDNYGKPMAKSSFQININLRKTEPSAVADVVSTSHRETEEARVESMPSLANSPTFRRDRLDSLARTLTNERVDVASLTRREAAKRDGKAARQAKKGSIIRTEPEEARKGPVPLDMMQVYKDFLKKAIDDTDQMQKSFRNKQQAPAKKALTSRASIRASTTLQHHDNRAGNLQPIHEVDEASQQASRIPLKKKEVEQMERELKLLSNEHHRDKFLRTSQQNGKIEKILGSIHPRYGKNLRRNQLEREIHTYRESTALHGEGEGELQSIAAKAQASPGRVSTREPKESKPAQKIDISKLTNLKSIKLKNGKLDADLIVKNVFGEFSSGGKFAPK